MTTPVPRRPRPARDRDMLDRARNTGRSLLASVPSAKGLKQGVGLSRRPQALDEARRHLTKARPDAGTDWVEQTSRARHLEAALAALGKAQREAPLDGKVLELAEQIGDLAAVALKEQGGQVSGRRQEDRVDRRLQAVVDSAQAVADDARVRQSRQAHLDAYMTEGAKPKDAGGFTKLSANSHHSAPAPAPSGSAKIKVPGIDRGPSRDLDEVEFEAEVTRWLSSKTAFKDPELAKKHVGALYSADQTRYQRIRRKLGDAYRDEHGLHAAEAAAITTYSNSDYSYMNPAMAGGAEDASWLKAVGRGNKDLYASAASGDDRKTARTKVRAQQAAVKAHERKLAATDAAFDAFLAAQAKPGAAPLKRPAGPKGTAERLERARQADLDVGRVEGATHAAVARRGLLRLPPWRGTLFRGDAIADERFNKMFHVDKTSAADGSPTFDIRSNTGRHTWPHLVSMSRASSVAGGFGNSGPHKVTWQISVLDGREMARLSTASHELEVMVLNGTTIAIDSVEVVEVGRPGMLKTPPDPTPAFKVLVKGHQISPVQVPSD